MQLGPQVPGAAWTSTANLCRGSHLPKIVEEFEILGHGNGRCVQLIHLHLENRWR